MGESRARGAPETTAAAEASRDLGDLLAEVLATGALATERWRPITASGLQTPLRPCAAAPLYLESRVIGVLVVDNAFNGRPITAVDQQNLQTLADLAAVAVERARLHERLRRMAEQDGLTGLLNRRSFEERFDRLLTLCRRQGEPLSLLLLDADHFKRVNDQLGHQVGDQLLRGIAQMVQARIRQGDLAGRYGGDELVVALSGARDEEALRVATDLCAVARALPLGAEGNGGDPGRPPGVTPSISVGGVQVRPEHADLAAVLAEADAALYAAKRAGRGRAHLYRPAPSRPAGAPPGE